MLECSVEGPRGSCWLLLAPGSWLWWPSKMATRKENTLPSIGLRHCRSSPWRCSDHLFMCPRKNNGTDHFWNYPDLCPEDLIRSFHLKPDSINQDELLRAGWFWQRRPKVLCANLILLFSYILVLVCLLYFLPESAPVLLVWLVVGATGVMVDCFRLDRWRREYELSIKRLILFLSKPK